MLLFPTLPLFLLLHNIPLLIIQCCCMDIYLTNGSSAIFLLKE